MSPEPPGKGPQGEEEEALEETEAEGEVDDGHGPEAGEGQRPNQAKPGEEVAGERRGDQASKATSDEEDGGDPDDEFHSLKV